MATNQGAFVAAVKYAMDAGFNSILKELYAGETWAVTEWKAGSLSELEIHLYDREIQRYNEMRPCYESLIYADNPFLKLIPKQK